MRITRRSSEQIHHGKHSIQITFRIDCATLALRDGPSACVGEAEHSVLGAPTFCRLWEAPQQAGHRHFPLAVSAPPRHPARRMSTRPIIFISAVSKALHSARDHVAKTLTLFPISSSSHARYHM
jgi:hypothetical protein